MSDDAGLPGRPPGATAAEPRRSRFGFTVTRPVSVLVVFLAVMVFGAFSMGRLPLDLMPDISYPKLTVRTEYPGAAPGEVENNVSRTLEEALGVVTGLTRVESISRAGYSDVILEFGWDTDMDDANQDVLEKLDIAKPTLPQEVKQPLILRYDPTLDPVLVLVLSEIAPREGIAGLKFLRRVADREVRRLLEPIPGVAAVKVRGGLEEEVHVDVDEDQLRRTGIGIDVVISRLAAENINLAGGGLRDGRTRYLVRTVNEFRDLDDLRNLVVVSRQGRDIRLRDLAHVESGHKDRDVITRVDGAEAVEIEVFKESDANIVEMAGNVRRRLEDSVIPRLEKDHGTRLNIASDRSRFIESSVREVRDAAVSGGILATLVLFLFLRDLRTTAAVAVSIPISVLMTFAPMHLGSVSLNVMSLGGLALGIGMLVDNSIVVLESIHRCREEGSDLVTATLRGTEEVGGAVVASTLTTVAVFLPMVFVEGVAGQMFGDLGMAVVLSLLASLAVALFFVPMVVSRQGWQGSDAGSPWRGLRGAWQTWGLREAGGGRLRRPWWWWVLLLPPTYVLLRVVTVVLFELVAKLLLTLVVGLGAPLLWVVVRAGRLAGWLLRPLLWFFERFVVLLERGYPRLVRWSLRNKAMVAVLALGGIVAAGRAALDLETELVPEMHQGEFTVEAALPVGTPLPETDRVIAPLDDTLRATVPHLAEVAMRIGSERDSNEAGERGEHTARIRVALGGAVVPDAPAGTPRRARLEDPRDAEEEALMAVRDAVRTIPDLRVHVSRPVLFSFKAPIEVEVRGYDLAELDRATRIVEDRLALIPGLRDVKGSILPGSPEIQITYDRDALSRAGLDIRKVAELVRDKVQGREATKYNLKDRKVPIRVRVQDIADASLQELRELVVNPGGTRPIPLQAVAELVVGRGPNEIRRIGQQRVGVVTANLQGVALGSTADAVREAIEGLRAELPPGVTTAVTGQSQEWERSSQSLYLALGLSVFLVYVIMASQFESLVHPLVILVSVPLALIGVVGALWALAIPVSIVVFLGVILLVGIVVNNAIVLVDYVNQLRERGMPLEEALVTAGRVRLRPILMTTLTTVLGLLPMALGLGDGSEIRIPMAVTVIAGLSFSTLLTLVVVPTLYAAVARFGEERSGSAARRLEEELSRVSAAQLAAKVEEEAP